MLGTKIESAEWPQPCQASNDLESSHRQLYFILPSGEHIPQVLPSNLATRPRFDRINVQDIIDAQQPAKLPAFLSRYTFTAFVADSGHRCDYLLPPSISFGKHHTADYRIQAVPLRPKPGSFTSYKSAASKTAKSATRNGEIFVLKAFKNSFKTASNVCKGNSISPSGFSAQPSVHSSIHIPIQNILSRGRETSREPETSECSYTVLKDLGKTYTRDNSITVETWSQKITAEEETAKFRLERALKTTIKGVDRCESVLRYGSETECSYLSKDNFSDRRMIPQVLTNYRDSCPSGNDHVLRARCCHSHRTSNHSFNMKLPSSIMQKSSAGDTQPQFYSTGDALSKTNGKGLMRGTSFAPSFKSWSSIITKQHSCFLHRLPFLAPTFGRYWLFRWSQKQQHWPPHQLAKSRPWLPPAQHWLLHRSSKQQHQLTKPRPRLPAHHWLLHRSQKRQYQASMLPSTRFGKITASPEP